MHAHERARLSLDGLSVGDTFGERFFGPPDDAVRRIRARELPPPPWPYTDDTEMALSVFEVLHELGNVDQDALARRLAERMQPGRGYGVGAYEILTGIRSGGSWRVLSRGGFRGMGSLGNGAAMRVGPLGGFFADAPIEALWTTVSALGDRDTTCAVVGSILALKLGRSSIPNEWRAAREKLPLEIDQHPESMA